MSVDTLSKLSERKAFIWFTGRDMNVLCIFDLGHLPTGRLDLRGLLNIFSKKYEE